MDLTTILTYLRRELHEILTAISALERFEVARPQAANYI